MQQPSSLSPSILPSSLLYHKYLFELLMLLLTCSPCGPPLCYHGERNCSPCIIKQFELTWVEFNYVTHEALLLEAFKSNIVGYMLGGSVFRYIIQSSQLYLHATGLLNEYSGLCPSGRILLISVSW